MRCGLIRTCATANPRPPETPTLMRPRPGARTASFPLPSAASPLQSGTMPDLAAALQSGDLAVLLTTAVTLGVVHTILGPDHYLPFVMMAKAQRWAPRRVALVTFCCGLGHVGSSALIAVALALAGHALADWTDSRFAALHDARGPIAAWLLIGVGAAFTVWGVVRALRRKTHTHLHVHADGTVHAHAHTHAGDHAHAHTHEDTPARSVRRLTPWVLFTIFIFGPCEALIPLMLVAWSTSGPGGAFLVGGVFAIATIATIMLAVALLLAGVSLIPLGALERWTTALAGLALVACGGAIQWLGL